MSKQRLTLIRGHKEFILQPALNIEQEGKFRPCKENFFTTSSFFYLSSPCSLFPFQSSSPTLLLLYPSPLSYSSFILASFSSSYFFSNYSTLFLFFVFSFYPSLFPRMPLLFIIFSFMSSSCLLFLLLCLTVFHNLLFAVSVFLFVLSFVCHLILLLFFFSVSFSLFVIFLFFVYFLPLNPWSVVLFLVYCDAYARCWATTQYTRSSEHKTIGAVFFVDTVTDRC
jgi:hypothetical protein